VEKSSFVELRNCGPPSDRLSAIARNLNGGSRSSTEGITAVAVLGGTRRAPCSTEGIRGGSTALITECRCES
jgi:hypothetical protein